MTGFTSSQQMYPSKRAERLFKKHMVEKRRRNRINGSLEQLKALVLTGLNKDPEQYDKIEKADILDLTVSYLKQLTTASARGQQVPVQPVQYTQPPLVINTHNMHMQQHQAISSSMPAHQGLLQIAVDYDLTHDMTHDVSQQCRSLSPSSSCESSSSRSSTPSPQSSKYYSKKFQRYVDSDVETFESISPITKIHSSDVWRPW